MRNAARSRLSKPALSRRGKSPLARLAGVRIFQAFVLFLFWIGPASAAISVDSTVTAVSPNQVSSLTWSHVVGSGSNRILVVGISFRDGNVSASSVKYGGVSLTLIGAVNSGGNQNRTEMWYLLAPTTGTASIVVTMSASKAIAAASISFAGVHQSTPLGTPVTGTSNGSTTASVTLASASGQVVLDTVTANGDANSLTANGSQTPQWGIFSGSGDAGNARGAGSTKPGASSTTMSWTLGTSKPWSQVAVPLIAAPVAPAFVNLKTVQVTQDPVNGTTNPKYIPGAYALYTIQITNTAAGSPDSNTVFIYDAVPSNTALYVGDLSGAGSGPIQFADGSTSSALTYTFTSLASNTDNVDFSNNGGATYTYTPVPDGNGFDANVTHIRINPQGVFAPASAGNPSFQISFRVRVN